MYTSNFLEGIIVGAILGGIAGVLFAPSPGEETRKKLKSMAAENADLVDSAKDQTEDLIDKIFRDKIEDGQLNDCPLTFQELNKIRESFVYTLLNMLHSRIEYPKDSSKEEAPSNAT